MNLFSLPVRRPVATAMFFLAIFLMGAIAWVRIPVELMPAVTGEDLYVQFVRPGSEPEVVEREILMPLEARVSELPLVDETWAEIRDSGGTLTIRFEPGTDIKVRELDLRRLASELVRTQPRGTFIDVSARDLTAMARFVMFVQITGMDDRDSLTDFVDQRVLPRLLAVPGVSRVMAGGGAPRELTVRIDPDRCAAMGVAPEQVTAALSRTVSRERFLGGVEDEAGRTVIILDGRPRGVRSLAETRIDAGGSVLLRHVADVELGTGRENVLFRVNGMSTVAMIVFQDEGANLIRLGHALRVKMDELRHEFQPYGLDFVINFDSAELVEEQLHRLERLAVSGFFIALVVLFLFLRQWRAVCVVAVAVPASLLAALALLLLAGQSINLITLFGLAVGIGMLVDNSIVVYEAVQRALEHGATPDDAAEEGVRRTVRAILAASVTNAIVFLPIVFADFDDAIVRSLLSVMALAIILPMLGSLLVAVGLVPLLARRLAAPAAVARIEETRVRRERQAGFLEPDGARAMFTGLLMVVLRRPGAWSAGICFAVVITFVVAATWFAAGITSQEPPEAETIRMAVTIDSPGPLETAAASFERLEGAVMRLDGIKTVESFVQEEGGSLTVNLKPKGERPETTNATRVRQVVIQTARELEGISVDSQQSGMGGGGGGARGGGGGGLDQLLGQAPAEVVLSGPDARELNSLAREVAENLESIPEVASATTEIRQGQFEYRVAPDVRALSALGLTADQVLPALNVVRREGVVMRTGFTLRDGREIPMTVRRDAPEQRAGEDLKRMRLATPAGVMPLAALADVRRMPPSPAIVHHNGRREVTVTYRLSEDVPTAGPARLALEEQIRAAVQGVHRPVGYTIENPEPDASFSWFRKLLVPVVLLLFAVLAVTFESLTMPLLVLLSLPLTLLGATWALVLSGTSPDMMALVGALALIGLTVNPAILLVDRMQQRAWQGGRSAGAAALAAVRERTRPVLMTAATTVAGLWPLALVTGQENEIWPPFATIVMGGLVTSTLLTLLVMPVGFVFLRRLDELLGRLGPWIIIGWLLATAAVVVPLFEYEVVTSLTWQVVTVVLVSSLLLGLVVLLFRRPEHPEPKTTGDGPPVVDVRYLSKIYGQPGPVGRAWHAGARFARRVMAFGGDPFDPASARARLLPLALLLGGTLYLALSLQTLFWRIVFLFVAAAMASQFFKELRRARGKTDRFGKVDPGGPESAAAFMMPWVAMLYAGIAFHLLPRIAEEPTPLVLWLWIVGAVVLAIVQFGRRTARRIARGDIEERLDEGRLRRLRTLGRRLARRFFGLDLPREEVHALSNIHFQAASGMVGILGPNGAGKTTLLRNLAGILDPSLGMITIGDVPLKRLRRYLARYVGYLPQDFGLPEDLTAREYLEYYALHYELRPADRRLERIDRLLKEVGLGEKADQKIGSYSGGMRQRVAVARTLLRLPPIIIVDEPTVGLDPRERIRFRNLLSRLAEGRVVLFSTHVVEDVEVACERVIVLARGRVVFDGLPVDLAQAARGRVWVTHLQPGDEASLAEGAMVVDQVPEASGTVRTRILHASAPHVSAEAAAPSLEDGYLWLVGEPV